MPPSVVAIITNSLTPYRLHYHQRLVREAPGIAWHSLMTHDVSNAPWSPVAEAEIRPVRFGVDERSDDQAKLGRARHEYRKGGQIIQWLINHQASAVVLAGYNDAGRLRILRWCRRNQRPCFLFGDSNIRCDLAAGLKAWTKRLLLRRVLRGVDGVLVCGSLGRAYFEKYGVAGDRIFYTPYEPDYSMIASITSQESADAFRRRGLDPGRNYIVYCGRLARVKRVDLLIKAFVAVLGRERPDWDLLIIGDGPLRADLEALLPGPLRHRAHWTGFMSDQRNVAQLLRGGKVLVLPSDLEPWGVVINEAVAAGLAVIATDVVGAAAELVRDRINGRIISCGDGLAMIQALVEVTDAATLVQYRAASPGLLSNWRHVADPVAGLLAALASAGVTPGAAG